MKRSPLRRKSLTTKTSTKKARVRKRSWKSEKAKLDQESRAFVMDRDGHSCQLKGIGTRPPSERGEDEPRPVTCSRVIQWCHIKSRRYLSTRWLPSNAFAACAAHHRWMHDHPDEFGEWWLATYPDRVEEVRLAFAKGEAPFPDEVRSWLKAGP